MMTYMAIAAEASKHPSKREHYRIWFLEMNDFGEVVGIGVKEREDLVQDLFANYRRWGKSNWRAFRKDAEASVPVEIFDFISQNMHENTHFGDLPTLSEFQDVLNHLKLGLELRTHADLAIA